MTLRARKSAIVFLVIAALAGCGPVKPPTDRTIKATAVTPAAAPIVAKTEAAIVKIGDPMKVLRGIIAGIQDVPLRESLDIAAGKVDLAIGDAQFAAKEATAAAKAKDAEAVELRGELEQANVVIRELVPRAEKAEAFIAEHNNDIFGAKTHRFFKALTFWTLLGVGIFAALIIGVGVVGSMYGLPALTKPVFGSVGGLLEGIRYLLYHAATTIWSFVPVIGIHVDDKLNKIGAASRAPVISKAAAKTAAVPAAPLSP